MQIYFYKSPQLKEALLSQINPYSKPFLTQFLDPP